jgi:dipeptidyl-peptidase-3
MRLAVVCCLLVTSMFISCAAKGNDLSKDNFKYFSEKFADLQILRYRVPGFEELTPQQKKLLYYLYEAALSGRDIFYDQNYKHNLTIRRTLEAVVRSYSGDRSADDFQKFLVYAKRVWFSNGIHHHYSSDKILPDFSREYFTELVKNSPNEIFPLVPKESLNAFIARLTPILFDPALDAKRVSKDSDADLVTRSANNYYEGVTQKEVEAFYAGRIDKNDLEPISYGLNSKLVKEGGRVQEKIWKVGGMYSEAIKEVVHWLEKAVAVSENAKQKTALMKLIQYYQTGDLRTFDEYNIAWVQDTASKVDVINGFIETYGDALGYRAAYEALVSFVDPEATKRIVAIGNEAQWFEDNSPIMAQYKKENIKGIAATVITVVVASGESSPSTPLGINLPNANWIRANHGSKSVSLGNINDSYAEADKTSGMLEEFGYSEEQNTLERKYGTLADNLHTDMHEVIGHASGKLNPKSGTPKETLKSYAAVIEESRANLVALYYALDPKLVEIGVMPNMDVGKVLYIRCIRNDLVWQLRRIKLGDDIEQTHMRGRQMISKWVYEKGRPDNVIEKVVSDEKTYFVIKDFQKARKLFGQLLHEVQRIKSEGDYEAAKNLVETYGVKIDYELHKEVLGRYSKLTVAPYSGFINPRLIPVVVGDEIVDVKIEYPEDFKAQMLEYAKKYSFLPHYN